MMSLEGKRALITGASRGIGSAIARRLLADGAEVILTARTVSALEELAAELGPRASVLEADMGDRGSLARLMDQVQSRVGGLDILINNAGVLPTAVPASDVGWPEWDATLGVNLSAPWYLACRAKRLMGNGGVIVNTASTAAFYPSRGLVAYNVSKAALVMLTRVLALEWARDDIRVIGIAPGKIDTQLVEPIVSWSNKRQHALNPMNRLGSDHEVAELVAFLVSDKAAYISGITVPIDGGELLAASAEAGR
jgi:3-oxoacyl-[acyl-carrier protein] reductase